MCISCPLCRHQDRPEAFTPLEVTLPVTAETLLTFECPQCRWVGSDAEVGQAAC